MAKKGLESTIKPCHAGQFAHALSAQSECGEFKKLRAFANCSMRAIHIQNIVQLLAMGNLRACVP